MPGNGLWKKTEVERCGLLVLYVEAQIKTGCIKMGVVHTYIHINICQELWRAEFRQCSHTCSFQ